MAQLTALAASILLQATSAGAVELPAPRAGDVYEIRLQSDTEMSGDQSTGSTHDQYAYAERVIAVRDTGVELEFDLPADVSAEDRQREWQMPARVLRTPEGPLQLLNAPELEERLARWLRAGEIPREACGHWIFTWNAFKIECDPQSVLETIATIDIMPGEVREGGLYRDALAREPAILRRETQGANRPFLVAEMVVDPEIVRRANAKSDIVVAEITRRESLAMEAALQGRATDQISGTIRVTFEMDEAAHSLRRTKITRLEIVRPVEGREIRTTTETTEWRLVSNREP